jgi:hypothetical protein
MARCAPAGRDALLRDPALYLSTAISRARFGDVLPLLPSLEVQRRTRRRSASLLANENNLTLGLGSAACFFDADGKRIGGFDGSRRMETRTNETVIGD